MIEVTIYIVVLLSILLMIVIGAARQRRLSAAYIPPWISSVRPSAMSALELIGKTPANRYIASVVLEDGTNFRSVIFECSYESKDYGTRQVRAVIGRTATPVDPKRITSVSACPDRVPNSLCNKAVSLGESAMGCYRVNIQFTDGTGINDFVCDCPDIIDNLPAPHRIDDIVAIERLDHWGRPTS